MERVPVDSSNIAAVGFDSTSETLEVEFKNGAVYQYFDVPERTYEELRDASSVGGYLASHVKGSFRFSKV